MPSSSWQSGVGGRAAEESDEDGAEEEGEDEEGDGEGNAEDVEDDGGTKRTCGRATLAAWSSSKRRAARREATTIQMAYAAERSAEIPQG